MKLACRKMCVSKTTFGRPGCSDLMTSSTPWVTCKALPHGNFSTTSSRPGPSSTMASPASGWWSSLTTATDPMGTWAPSLLSTVTWARSPAVTIGSTWRMPSRWAEVSIEPPVPMMEPLENLNRPESTESAVASIRLSRLTFCAAILSGSACTVIICSRSPQMATLATPGTRNIRARIVQYAIMDISISESSFDVMPIFITRLVADNGGSMTGGAAQVGRKGVTLANRSCTSCRTRSWSASGLKISWMLDNCGTDLERMSSSPSMPLRTCSSGTVTRDSTSPVDRPLHMVWISTRGGANSGNTSTGIFASCSDPTPIISRAIATTMNRNRRLVSTIHRIRPRRRVAVIRQAPRIRPRPARPPLR